MKLNKLLLQASIFAIAISAFIVLSAFTDGPGSNEITKSEILEHITYLASDELQGRFPGTEGDLLTQKYISEEFSKYKLNFGQ